MARTMDERFAAKLDEHRKEFYLAYKTHMYTVQEKVRDMRLKADREESKMLGDRRIGALKAELDWFMTESLRLDDYCEGYKQEIERWKAKVQAMDQERRLIESQVKTAKRQNKVLKATAERAQACADSAVLFLDTQRTKARATSSGSRLRSQKAISGALARSASSVLLREIQPGSAARSSPTARMHLSGAGSCPLLPSLQPSERPSQGSYLSDIRGLEAKLAKSQQETRMLRASNATSDSQRSQLEELFLQCVREAKQSVLKSKAAAARLPKSKSNTILQAMLGNDSVLVLLYERIFPHRNALARSLSSG